MTSFITQGVLRWLSYGVLLAVAMQAAVAQDLRCQSDGGIAECVGPLVGEWYTYASALSYTSTPQGSEPPTSHCWIDPLTQTGACHTEQEAWDVVVDRWLTSAPVCSGPRLSACAPPNDEIVSRYIGVDQWVTHGFDAWVANWSNGVCPAENRVETCSSGNGAVSWKRRSVVCPPGYFRTTEVPQEDSFCKRIRPDCRACGYRISLLAGPEIHEEVDIPTTPGSLLHFSRRYDSGGYFTLRGTSRSREAFGTVWRHNYQNEIVLEPGAAPTLVYAVRSDGSLPVFAWNGTAWVGRPDLPERLEEMLDGLGQRIGWKLVTANDDVEAYDANGSLLSITQRSGLGVSLTYSTASTPAMVAPHPGLLIAAVDSYGRTLQWQYDSAGLLTQMIDAAGTVHGYRYDDQHRLAYVDTPDAETRQYLYNEATHLSFSPKGMDLLTGIVDENGTRFATYEYNSAGTVSKEWLGSGAGLKTLTYGSPYSTASNTSLTDALGLTRRYKFVLANGRMKDAGISQPSCTGSGCTPLTVVSSITYDANGNKDLVTDYAGTVTDFDYNTRGLETRRVDASNASGVNATTKRTTETTWSSMLNVPDQRTVKNSTGAVETQTKWTYNSRGQATARCQIDPAVSGASSYACGSSTNAPTGVRQTLTTYCESGDVTAGTCPLVGLVTSVNGARLTTDAGMASGDDITTYAYRMADDSTCASAGACTYRKGDLWKVTNALGQVTEYASYDRNGRVTRIKDANGTYTDFAYHARGWLTGRTVRNNSLGTSDPGDATLHIDYDAVGNVTQVTQPDGAYLHYTYDDAHRLTKISDNLSNSIDYCPGGVGTADCLDAAGNRKVEQVKDPSSAVKRQLHRVYNQLGQLTQVLNAASTPVETSAGIAGTNIVDGYDRNGNRVFKDDGLAVRTQQDYDPLNRLKKTIQNLAGADMATQNTSTSYTYDARDNLRQVTDPDNLNTVYTYDGLNNLTDLDSPDTGHTHYAYDASGNRISQTDNRTPSVTSTYAYDALNRLTGVTYPTSSLDVDYAYDQSDATTGCSGSFPLGRLTTMTDATGSTTYCYDRRGNVTRKTQVTSGTTLVTQYGYTAADRIASITYPSGGIVTYTRDALGRVQSITWQASGGSVETLVGSAAYLPFGPLTTLTFGNGRTLTKAYDQDYAIDSISGTPAGALTLDLGVDVMGDITSASATLGASPADRVYGYDALYRLKTSQTGASSPLEAYTYSKTGDRLSASLSGGAASAYTYATGTHHLASVGGVARTYDGNGNTLTGTSSGLTLTYDDRNRLASMINGTTSATYAITGRGERVGKTVTVSGTPATTLFGYDEGGRLIGEYTGTGAIQAEYIYLDSIPVGVFKGGALYYIETDHLGTPRQVVKPATNTVVWKWDFMQNTFGNSTPDEDPDGDLVPFGLGVRFPGQYFDAETGTNYNYYRDAYEPSSGRYLQSDPIGLRGGINAYSYALNNTWTYADPSGLASTCRIALTTVGAIAGGAAGYGCGCLLGGIVGGGAGTLVAPGVGTVGGAGAGCSGGGSWGGAAGAAAGAAAGNAAANSVCDDEPDCKRATPFHLAKAGITDAEAFKEEYVGKGGGKFDICACKDGSIQLKAVGQCGKSGPGIPTGARWQ